MKEARAFCPNHRAYGQAIGRARCVLFLLPAVTAFAAMLVKTTFAQAVVPVGGGSYASSIPAVNWWQGGFYSMTAQQVVTQYNLLHLDAALTNRPIPSNQWWTDLLVGDRSYQPSANTPRVIAQDAFGGDLWVLPAMLNPESTGFNLHFPKTWRARSNANVPEGGFDPGPALQVSGGVTASVGANDVLIADFEGANYPAGWTTTGTAFGAGPVSGGGWPGQSPTVTGFIGNACVNTYRGSDAPQGTLTSPSFTVSRKFIHLLSGGGTDTNLTAVRLLVGTNIVRAAAGQQNGTLTWKTWDVSEWLGQTAQIQLADLSSGGWGFILCDFIVASDDGASPAARYTDKFTVLRAVVTDWSDWGVRFRMPDALGNQLAASLARGVPFVWLSSTGVRPRLNTGTITVYNTSGTATVLSNGLRYTNSAFSFDYQGRVVGVFAPDNTVFQMIGSQLEAKLDGTNNFLVLGLLPALSNVGEFAQYAFAEVVGTRLDWNHDRTNGVIRTTWSLDTRALKGSQTNTLQGWLPHHYRSTQHALAFRPYTYLTPRGVMKVAVGRQFEMAYPFRGVTPVLPAPRTTGLANDYIATRMSNYVAGFIPGHPGSINDTYWAGKDLGITAQYLGFARQLGFTNLAGQLTTKLRGTLTNWFTYTPGETRLFFARYPNWRALVGFEPSFGAEAFNDNHFHYGYFTVAAALLGMHDPDFLTRFGPMARLVAKEYANWDRVDTDFPLFRTFDIWEGHSWAGGFSGSGGNNQESSSEAMNSWAGLFLLGSMLGDDAMAAAGAMGYAMESAAVNEYWQDTTRSNLPATYGKGMAGILWGNGVSYGTYFSGDPAWIHAIQWVPALHWNNYLARDPAFANWQLANLWTERVVADQYALSGFDLTDSNNVAALGGYLGNYVLGFQLLFDQGGAAALLDAAWTTNGALAKDTTYAGVSYYLTHSLRVLGPQDLNYYASLPTSAVHFNPATARRTAVLYNPSSNAQAATLFYKGGVVTQVPVPPRTLITVPVTNAPPRLSVTLPAFPGAGLPLTVQGTPGAIVQLESSDNLSLWTNTALVALGATGLTNILAPLSGNPRTRFFRAAAN